MAVLTVRNLPDEIHRALKVRAAQHGRSTEAEVRDILEKAVRPQQRVRVGTALAAIGRKYRLQDDEIAALGRDRAPVRAGTARSPRPRA